MQFELFYELEDAAEHSEPDAVDDRPVILFPVEERWEDCLFRQDIVPTYRAVMSFSRRIQNQNLLVALMPENENGVRPTIESLS